MKSRYDIAVIGNGVYARVESRLSLLDEYRERQVACDHSKRDPRGMCYKCGHVAKSSEVVA